MNPEPADYEYAVHRGEISKVCHKVDVILSTPVYSCRIKHGIKVVKDVFGNLKAGEYQKGVGFGTV